MPREYLLRKICIQSWEVFLAREINPSFQKARDCVSEPRYHTILVEIEMKTGHRIMLPIWDIVRDQAEGIVRGDIYHD